MQKLLILQNIIPHYRKPLYNELSKYFNVTVLHSGKRSVESKDNYREVIKSMNKLGPFYIQNGVLSEVKKRKYDIIISMLDARWINNIFAMFFHNKKTKFIWWGAWLTGNYIADKIKIYLTNKKHASIFYCRDARESFVRLGINKEKLFVANNTFHVEYREIYNDKLPKTNILFVGSLNKRKQLDILIKSYSQIQHKIDNLIRLVIIGEGEEKATLERLVKKLRLQEKVSFLGRINETKNLSSHYKRAIVSVSFGQAGLTVLQSLGYGVPFITKKNAVSGGEKTNIIHGYNGYLCEDSQRSLENAIVEICNNKKKAMKMSKNSFEYYTKNCTIENMVSGFKKAINYKENT